MTFEEGRAQFPVLDRYAYLQAGSVGPLARGTIDAMRAAEEAGFEEGRGSITQFTRLLEAREELRAELAALVGVDVDKVAITASTTDGCNIVLAGLDLQADDEIVTTTDEHFGLLGPLHMSGAKVVVVEPDPERIVDAVTERTRLIAVSHVLWTTGATLPVHELRARPRHPDPRGWSAVGRSAPCRRGRPRLLHGVRTEVALWAGGDRCARRRRPAALRVAGPSYLSQQGYEPDGTFKPKDGAARFDPNVTPNALVAGLRAAMSATPAWAHERAVEMAERFRSRLAESGHDVVVPKERATLVSWRAPVEESASVVERLADAGVIVRDLPGRGLIRASVGWWTNDDDLERLVASL